MATRITAAHVKAHLQRPDLADTDPDLVQKMEVAEAVIVNYVTNGNTYWTDIAGGWTDATNTPVDVQHAMLLKVAELWRYRGDELEGEGPKRDEASDMSPEIVRLLRRWRDPVLV
jgi:hypothetical protein